ncbi:hypothetical protein KFK09_012514 [Dendrobium nobile]|uniref:Reverse transcriptase domain-containing protein n=1 Tax=Dendrobium nobile TaxID=94219 RepID=A0A8T3BHX7_DENNO|nr:hypothetical protein KFK09_012514 [Dendrobium nobile]
MLRSANFSPRNHMHFFANRRVSEKKKFRTCFPENMFVLDGFTLTHLLYADDVLTFGEATTENCVKLNSILNTFANASGLRVNLDKSTLMLPKNLLNSDAICQALSSNNISSKITYLGIPLSFNRQKIADFMTLIDSTTKTIWVESQPPFLCGPFAIPEIY